MAIARGAGTEIIRTAMFEYAGGNTVAQDLIIGAQHHIYTVLSIVCFAKATSGGLEFYLTGYDCQGGDSAQNVILFQAGTVSINQTYVINDKFSFNGCEPTDLSGGSIDGLDTIAKQEQLADQGTSTSQILRMAKSANGDQWEVLVSFIDQNNA